jgi:hypothetical protein
MKGSWRWVVGAGLGGIVVGIAVAFALFHTLPWAFSGSGTTSTQSQISSAEARLTPKLPQHEGVPVPGTTRNLPKAVPRSKDPLVATLQEACAPLPEKLGCYQKRLQEIVKSDGTEQALNVLEQLAAEDEDVLREGHPLAHEIGRFSYQHYKDAPTAFAHCRELFTSGCFHGVLEAFLSHSSQVKPEEIATLCSGISGERGQFIKFQCLHGLGHGLTMYFHELNQALSTCDYLTTQWERESCYGGVFMENIVAANTTNPHHAHLHFLKPEDPLYPCNSVDKKYQASCYLMQSSAILMLNGYDFSQAFRECEKAPTEFIAVCYQSMGRDISGFTLRNAEEAIQLCMLGTERYIKYCLEGVVKDIVNTVADAAPGFSFCRQVAEVHKWSCYQSVGEMLVDLYPEVQQRLAECAKAEERYMIACKAAARR